MFAVAGVCKQSIDEFFHSVGSLIGDKKINLLWRERQSNKIERQPASQHCAGGFRLRN